MARAGERDSHGFSKKRSPPIRAKKRCFEGGGPSTVDAKNLSFTDCAAVW
jgi:hypothetical protein